VTSRRSQRQIQSVQRERGAVGNESRSRTGGSVLCCEAEEGRCLSPHVLVTARDVHAPPLAHACSYMRVCMYTRALAYAYVCTCVLLHTRMYVCMCVLLLTNAYVCMCMLRTDLGKKIKVKKAGGKLMTLLSSPSAQALGLCVDGQHVRLGGNAPPPQANAPPPAPAAGRGGAAKGVNETKAHGQRQGAGSPEKQWLARIASHLRQYHVQGPARLSILASQAGVPRPPGVSKNASLSTLIKRYGRDVGLRLSDAAGACVCLDEQDAASKDTTLEMREIKEMGGSASAVGTPAGGVDVRRGDRQVKETALLFWNYVRADADRKERCCRRNELEAEFLRFRESQNQMHSQQLPKTIRSPSGMIRYLATQARLIRLAGNEVTFVEKRGHIDRARKAAAQLIASRDQMQNCHGVSIEPPLLECLVAVGEEVRETFRIKVDASSPITTITAVQFLKQSPSDNMRVQPPPHARLPFEVAPGSEVSFDITGKTDQPGQVQNVVVFAFRCSVAPFEFKICRVVSIRGGNKEIEELLKPSRPYVRAKLARQSQAGHVIDGEAPATFGSLLPYVNPLAQYSMPSLFRSLMGGEDQHAAEFLLDWHQKLLLVEQIVLECPETYILDQRMNALDKYAAKISLARLFASDSVGCKVCAKRKDEHYLIVCSKTDKTFHFCRDPRLTLEEVKCSTYSMLYSHLLWAEERAMQLDIRAYDMEAASLIEDKRGYLFLKVPGLSENRPSILRGDAVLARPSWSTVDYKGYAHRVEKDGVALKFSRDLHNRFVTGTKFHISFSFRRSNLRAMHQGVSEPVIHPAETRMTPERGGKLGPMLFPRLDDVDFNRGGTSPPEVSWNDDRLNPEQKRAVGNILLAHIEGLKVPYIVFGPPGTGKTRTVCEAVFQLSRHHTQTGAVLVTAPSNTAADLLLEKLSSSLSNSEMLRFMAYNRDPNQVSPVNKSYTYCARGSCGTDCRCCRCDDTGGVFLQPPLENLLKVKVVVATCCMAGKLFNLGMPRGHFDTVFIDEAGHAVEPEAVAAFSALHPKHLVLAGDPKQLGPVVRSDLANRYGLGTSYLERLGERPLYQPVRDEVGNVSGADTTGYKSKVITKLIRNYRSHPDILYLPNKLFYAGHLLPNQDKESEAYMRSYSLASWSELPAPGFPLIFHGIEGKNEREANSPSWFNIAECTQVLDYVKLLTSDKQAQVSACNIGIVTPYAKQVEKLTTLLRRNGIKVGGKELMIGSAEKFQGQERRVIIISTVRSSENFLEFDAQHNLGFVSNPKRFNVAVTRAQALLIVVGNASILAKDKCWGELLWMCHDKGAYKGMSLPPRNAEDEEKRAAAMLQTFTDVQLDLDVSDDEYSNLEQYEGAAWRDAD